MHALDRYRVVESDSDLVIVLLVNFIALLARVLPPCAPACGGVEGTALYPGAIPSGHPAP